MTQRTQLPIFVLVLLAVGLVACQEAPTQQLTLAEQSLAAAETAEASTYASEELATAGSALELAKAEVEAQNEKLALFRNYEEAGRLIAAAEDQAQAAETAAIAGKEKARNEAEASLAAATTSYAEAETLLAELSVCPVRPKGSGADLAVMQGRLDGLKSESQSIQTALQSGQYTTARTQAEAFRSQIQPFLADMSLVKLKLRC